MATIWTDGYITHDPDGDWRYSNAAGSGRGEVASVQMSAWCRYRRFEENNGFIAGTKIDESGVIAEGPIAQFTAPGQLLAAVPKVGSKRPFIAWAGVSPMSLREVLIVWNNDIVLLNKAGVTGGEAVSVVGRLMIVKLANPLAIDAEEVANIKIAAGAIGFYSSTAQVNNCAIAGNLTQANGNSDNEGGLQGLPGPLPIEDCECCEVKVGASDDGEGNVAGPILRDAAVFCDICGAGQCAAEAPANAASFVVNNAMSVPVRCVHPFALIELRVCQCEEDAPTPCEDPCPIWVACLAVFGTTGPQEVLPLDNLFELTPCDASEYAGQNNNIYGTVSGSGDCCGDVSVEIQGHAGPLVIVAGKWRGQREPEEGQACYINYQCQCDPCKKTCTKEKDCATLVYPDEVHGWVEDDIIKPIPRTLPVDFFDNFAIGTSVVTIPPTLISETTEVVTDIGYASITGIANVVDSPLQYPTTILNDTINFPTEVINADVTYLDPVIGDLTTPTSVITQNVTAVTAVETDVVEVVTGVTVVTSNLLTSVELTQVDVPTAFASDTFNVVTDLVTNVETDMMSFVSNNTNNVLLWGPGQTPVQLAEDVDFGTDVFRQLGVVTTDPVTRDLVSTIVTSEEAVVTAVNAANITMPVGDGALITDLQTATLTAVAGLVTSVIPLVTGTGKLVDSVGSAEVPKILGTADVTATAITGLGGLVSSVEKQLVGLPTNIQTEVVTAVTGAGGLVSEFTPIVAQLPTAIATTNVGVLNATETQVIITGFTGLFATDMDATWGPGIDAFDGGGSQFAGLDYDDWSFSNWKGTMPALDITGIDLVTFSGTPNVGGVIAVTDGSFATGLDVITSIDVLTPGGFGTDWVLGTTVTVHNLTAAGMSLVNSVGYLDNVVLTDNLGTVFTVNVVTTVELTANRVTITPTTLVQNGNVFIDTYDLLLGAGVVSISQAAANVGGTSVNIAKEAFAGATQDFVISFPSVIPWGTTALGSAITELSPLMDSAISALGAAGVITVPVVTDIQSQVATVIGDLVTTPAGEKVFTVPTLIETEDVNVVIDVPTNAVTPVTYTAISSIQTEVVTLVSDLVTGGTPQNISLVNSVQTVSTEVIANVLTAAIATQVVNAVTEALTGTITQVTSIGVASNLHVWDQYPLDYPHINVEDNSSAGDIENTYVLDVQFQTIADSYNPPVHALEDIAEVASFADTAIQLPTAVLTSNATFPKTVHSGPAAIPQGGETTTMTLPTAAPEVVFPIVSSVEYVTITDMVLDMTEIVKNVPTDVLTGAFVIPTGLPTTSTNITLFDTLVTNVAVNDTKVDLEIWEPDGDPLPADLVTRDTDGTILLITSTSPDCDRKYKFLNHDGSPLQTTVVNWNLNECCDGGGATSVVLTNDHPAEVKCANLLTLVAKYVSQAAGDEASCPCFDGTNERDVDGTETEQQPGATNPCSIRVKRLQRNCPSLNCRP